VRNLTTVIAAVAGLATMSASAQARLQVRACSAYNGPIAASPFTSCGFARSLVSNYYAHCHGQVCYPLGYSSATHRTYRARCSRPEPVRCTTIGAHDSWVRFYYDN
jgi:hypothetical protein